MNVACSKRTKLTLITGLLAVLTACSDNTPEPVLPEPTSTTDSPVEATTSGALDRSQPGPVAEEFFRFWVSSNGSFDFSLISGPEAIEAFPVDPTDVGLTSSSRTPDEVACVDVSGDLFCAQNWGDDLNVVMKASVQDFGARGWLVTGFSID